VSTRQEEHSQSKPIEARSVFEKLLNHVTFKPSLKGERISEKENLKNTWKYIGAGRVLPGEAVAAPSCARRH
jgi:hypothetical protein